MACLLWKSHEDFIAMVPLQPQRRRPPWSGRHHQVRPRPSFLRHDDAAGRERDHPDRRSRLVCGPDSISSAVRPASRLWYLSAGIGQIGSVGLPILVSFAPVRPRPGGANLSTQTQVRTHLIVAVRPGEHLESVLGAPPHEFESRIFRTRPRGQTKDPTASQSSPSSFRGRSCLRCGFGAIGR